MANKTRFEDLMIVFAFLFGIAGTSQDSTVVDTRQNQCYNDQTSISCPSQGQAFFGQDGQYDGAQASYFDNGDGTVTDLVTGLMWQKTHDFQTKQDWQTALITAQSFNLAGYADWRLPTIKELYTLILFDGETGTSALDAIPYIDTDYFDFEYGDPNEGERYIDAQYWSATEYVSTTMNGNETVFGVNFADGRIKGYPTSKTNFIRYVRGAEGYGENHFIDRGDGTILDQASGLIWMQVDSGSLSAGPLADGKLNWEEALEWAETLDYAGYSDWRLPNAKELQMLVDYSRSPDTTSSAAIDPLFDTTSIVDGNGDTNFPYYWTSTTHLDGRQHGEYAIYIAFGEALGFMEAPPGSGLFQLWDVHGAGAQRSDPKTGDPDYYPLGHGPQGDVISIYNFVRCVRDAESCQYLVDQTSVQVGVQGGTGQLEISTDVSCDWMASSESDWIQLIQANGTGPGIIAYSISENHGSLRRGTIELEGLEIELIQDGLSSPVQVGMNLFAPMGSTTTYLMDNTGQIIQSWASQYRPGLSVYLLDHDRVLRTGQDPDGNFGSGGAGGIIEVISATGAVDWSYTYSNENVRQHHDIERLRNGNILFLAWELKSMADAIEAGRNPNLLSSGELWPDSIIEIEPNGDHGGNIVWEWHVWDHLIQDYDVTKSNYGVVADHPERINLNYTHGQANADWNHINSIDYNETLDQIVLSVRNFSEIWIIDHSTTTSEAAGSSGGNCGKGGDLLFRWGNPQTYDQGAVGDQQLFVQHDAQWIPRGYPGEGNLLIFNNGQGRPDGNYSSVDEVVPPLLQDGTYEHTQGNAFGPTSSTWSYVSNPSSSFYAQNISGAQRLPNGNTLICEGTSGYFFEVTDNHEIVWDYQYSGNVFRVTRVRMEQFSEGCALWNSTSTEHIRFDNNGNGRIDILDLLAILD